VILQGLPEREEFGLLLLEDRRAGLQLQRGWHKSKRNRVTDSKAGGWNWLNNV
jgi:hypothetical protein